MTLKNLAFCTNDPKPRSGTWKRRLDDLKRKGIGGVAEAVYATTLLHRVSSFTFTCTKHDLRWMCNIALAGLDLHLIDLPTSCECEQATSCDICISPMRQTQLDVVLWLQTQGMACPSQQRLSLADDPVLPAIKVDCDNARY